MGQPYYSSTPNSSLIVRVAGLPMSILLPLRFNQTMQLINDLLAKERALRAQAEPLSDALYSAIGAIEDKKIRYQVMALRRAIFNTQLPKPLGAHVWATLPSELVQTIKAWIAQMEQLLALFAQGQETLEAEWDEKSGEIQHIAQLEIFQQGLILASKDLYEDVARWLQDSSEGTPRRDRQLELGLLTYLSRTATKTSPFSTFMSSGRGSWIEHGPTLTYTTPWQRRSAVELNWSIAQHIASTIARWPEIQPTLALRVNTSLHEDDSYLSFLGWRASTARKSETIMKQVNSPIAQHVLQMISQAKDPSYAAILRAIAHLYPQRSADELQRGLDYLIEIGLLERDFGIPDLSPDYLGQLLTHLQHVHGSHVENILPLLQNVHVCLQHYATTTTAAERYRLRDTIYTTLNNIYQHLDQRGISVPAHNVFYENILLDGGNIRCSLANCQDLLSDLELLQQVSALYDQHVPGRLATTAFFVDHYGEKANISILRFYEDFCREQAQPGGWRPSYRVSGSDLGQLFAHTVPYPHSNLGELEQLRHLQEQFSQQYIQLTTAGASVIQMDTAALRECIAAFPIFLAPPSSLAFYGQMLIHDEKPQFVLNVMRSGFGRSEGQMQLLEAQVHKHTSPPRSAVSKEEQGPLWADVLGVFGSNASLRRAQTPYEITYPGTVSARPLDEQLALNDLFVSYNPATHRLQLVSQRLQREVVPVHLGMLDDHWQPPFYRFLIHLFSSGAVNALLPMIQIPHPEILGAALPVQAYPRLCLGNLVLRRATWLVGEQCLPKRAKGATAFEYMLKVQRWLVEHHIPQECFIRIPAANTKDRKPLYIDFSNYLNMMMFEQMVSHTEQSAKAVEQVLLLQEVLPGREDLVFSDGEAAYVSEWIIELTHMSATRGNIP